MTDYISLAIAYAACRWCWTDTSLIIELCMEESPNFVLNPDTFIDEQAEDFDLIDPFEPMGAFDTPEHRQTLRVVRDMIHRFNIQGT